LDEWPDRRVPLLQLDGGPEAANRLLADQCVLSSGLIWLSRLREPGIATKVRGKFVRPVSTAKATTIAHRTVRSRLAQDLPRFAVLE